MYSHVGMRLQDQSIRLMPVPESLDLEGHRPPALFGSLRLLLPHLSHHHVGGSCRSIAVGRSDPVATVDGCAYERDYIERWFRERRQANQAITSPTTGGRL